MERYFEKPVISIIIPAYNAQDYIARCIDSALASNFNDLEIIVGNDGSSDSSQQIIDWYVQNYPNVVSFQKENGGVADTRNYGIERARGEYIAFLDNDDMVRPNMLSTLYSSITKNSCDIAIAPLYRLVDKGYTTHCNLPFEEDKAINIDEYFRILYTPGYYNCAIWNKLYKADMVKAHPLGILKYEDVSWTPCILSYAKTFCFIKTPFYECDRKTRPETFGDVLARMPENDLLEHRRQAMMFFVENGNPEKYDTLKTIAKRRLMRYSKNADHNGYEKLIEQLN
jgi:glycosyltransferase involved in cell wall biosynthesis